MADLGLEKWRIITPIMLCMISALIGVNSFILVGLREDIGHVNDRLTSHIENQEIHYGLKKDIEWIKARLSDGHAYANDH